MIRWGITILHMGGCIIWHLFNKTVFAASAALVEVCYALLGATVVVYLFKSMCSFLHNLTFKKSYLTVELGTGIRGLMRGMATLP